jgi:hypothetical protein
VTSNIHPAVPIHPVVLARFGSDSAMPRAVRGYTAARGWVRMPQHPVLTPDAVHALKADGYTMVEARWHFTVKQISLVQLN